MRDDAGRKGETFFLSGSIDRSQQATACEPTSSRVLVHHDFADARQIDHHPVIASTESSKAVPSTTHGCEDSRSHSSPDRGLHVTDVSTAGDQGRAAGHHAVPDASRWLVLRIMGTQQIAAELLPQGAVDLVRSFLHVSCAWRAQLGGLLLPALRFHPKLPDILPVVLYWANRRRFVLAPSESCAPAV